MAGPIVTLGEHVREVGSDLDSIFLREGMELLTRSLMDLEISEEIGAGREGGPDLHDLPPERGSRIYSTNPLEALEPRDQAAHARPRHLPHPGFGAATRGLGADRHSLVSARCTSWKNPKRSSWLSPLPCACHPLTELVASRHAPGRHKEVDSEPNSSPEGTNESTPLHKTQTRIVSAVLGPIQATIGHVRVHSYRLSEHHCICHPPS
jgi:hypothetical protein